MSLPRRTPSVSSSLNYEAVSIGSERDLQFRENADEMKKEQYFLLKGFDYSEDGNQIEYRTKVEQMVQAEWDRSIAVKGFVELVDYRDFGLNMSDQQLSLLRLYSDIPCLFGKPLKIFKNGSVLVTIAEALKSYCCCDILLYQLEAIPGIVSLIKMWQENTGVTLGLDNASNFWLYGMWFQVAVTRRFINSEYAKVSTWNTVEDNNPEDGKKMLINLENLQQLLNGEQLDFNRRHKGKETNNHNKSQWFNVGLFCVTFLNLQIKDISDYLEITLGKDMDTNKVQLVVWSLSKNSCQKYCKDFTSQYEDNQEKYDTVPLPSTYPRSYRDMLKDMIQAKYHPYLTVTMNKGTTVDFVFARECLSEVEKFIRIYLECNAPMKASHINDLVIMAKPLGPAAWSCTDSLEEATSCTQQTIRKVDENGKVYFGILVKPELHVEYFQKECKQDLDIICMDHEAKLQFEKGQILIECEGRSKLINCLWRLEKLYSCLSIQTREFPLQYIAEDQRGLLMKQTNSTVVSVTGTSSALSIIAETIKDIGASPSLENISLNPATSANREHIHQKLDEVLHSDKKGKRTSGRVVEKRDRQLLDSTMQFTLQEEKTEVMENLRGRNHTVTGEYSYTKSAGTEAYQHIASQSYVEVGCGDITKLDVDAIVNAANYDLKHTGRVARAIVVAGGESIQTESTRIVQKRQLQTGDVCITDAGRLPCKMIIHAVVPGYGQYQNKQDCIADLGRTFWSCFDQANQNGFVSMAVPPLGAGLYAIPGNDVAEAACATLQDFLNKNRDTSLRLVRFVDIQDDFLAICSGNLDIMVRKKYFAKI